MLHNQREYDVVLANTKNEFLKNIFIVDAVISNLHIKEKMGMSFQYVSRVCDEMSKPLTLISGDICPYHDYQLQKPVSSHSLRQEVLKTLERGESCSKQMKRKTSKDHSL